MSWCFSRGRAESYGWWLLRWRRTVLIVTVFLWLSASAGMVFLRVNDDYRIFFDPDDPELAAYTRLQRVFTKNEQVVFAVAPRSGDVFTPESLAAIASLTDAAWELPFAQRVDSLTNYPYAEGDRDTLRIGPLIGDPAACDESALEETRKLVASLDVIHHSLVAPAGDVAGVIVTYQLPDNAPVEGVQAALAARQLARHAEEQHPAVSVHLTGSLILNNAFREAAAKDISTLIPLMYAVIVVLLFFFLRSFWSASMAVLVVVLSVTTAMGLAGWLGFDITATSTSAPTIIMTLAVADSVHLLRSLLARMRGGMERHGALTTSLSENLLPMFLTSLTTAIGFLSLNMSESPPFRDLGNMCALGIVAAFLYAVTTLPALAAVLPLRVVSLGRPGNRAQAWIAKLVIKRWRVLLPTMAVVVLALGAFIPMNELNDHITMYFNESNRFRKDVEFVAERLTGLYPIEYLIPAKDEGGIVEPAYLERLEAFTEWFRAQPDVVHVNSFSDIMKQINQAMHGGNPAQAALPQQRDLAAQYLLLYEMALPFGQDLNDRVDIGKSATRFVVNVGAVTSNEVISIAESGERWLHDNAPACMASPGLGPSVLFSRVAQRDTRGMLLGAALALALISLVLLLALRSVRMGLLSLVPNLVPAIMAFGVWGIAVGRIGMGLAAVLAVTLGIVVDDTVHFLTRYRASRRERGDTVEEALYHAFTTVGSAMVATSVVLIGGFAVLSFSSFEVNAAMGRLSALVIMAALAADLILLPCLLLLFDGEPAGSVKGDA